MRDLSIQIIVIILLILVASGPNMVACSGSNTVEPHEVALSIASVPAQVCIAVNQSRNKILTNAGDAIHEQSVNEHWAADRERETIVELHAQDDILRSIVSPGWDDSEGHHVGRCRTVTEYLERVSVNVDSFDDMESEGWQEAVSGLIGLIRELGNTLEALGITDVYGWLNDRVQIADTGLGDLLRDVLRFSENIISNIEGNE